MIYFLNIFFEFCCLLCAIVFLWRTKTFWNLFIPYLLVIVLIETSGLYTLFHKNENNHWIFNIIYLPLYISFTLLLINKICGPLFRVNHFIPLIAIVLLGTYSFEGFKYGITEFSHFTCSLANAIFTFFCCAYYYHLLKQDNFVTIKDHAPFWVITGLLLYCLGSTISYLFFEALVQINIKIHLPIRQIIFVVLNFMLYSCWSYAFLCRYRQKI